MDFGQISYQSKNEFYIATLRSWPTFFFQKIKSLTPFKKIHRLQLIFWAYFTENGNNDGGSSILANFRQVQKRISYSNFEKLANFFFSKNENFGRFDGGTWPPFLLFDIFAHFYCWISILVDFGQISKNDFNFRSFWKNFKKIEKNFDAKNLMSQLQEVGQLFFSKK
jgi:hypothetical protein